MLFKEKEIFNFNNIFGGILTALRVMTDLLQKDILNRYNKIQAAMQSQGVDVCIICSATNLFYTLGKVVNGYLVIFSQGDPILFQRRPVIDEIENKQYLIRKPEDIPAKIEALDRKIEGRVALEMDTLSVNDYSRLMKAFELSETVNANTLIRAVRTIKTDYEIALMRKSSTLHTQLYEMIPSLYKEGMSDYDIEIAIEYEARKLGSLGLFRIFGTSMEIFAGSVLAGENALTPSPYDFAMGGAGTNESMPVGANNKTMEQGQTLMVDVGGNFTGYMSDMTRVFAIGELKSDLAKKAHATAIEIENMVMQEAKPGVLAKELYEKAMEIVAESEVQDYFMGYKQKAAFIGHGVGIEINEQPVFSARSRDVLEEGMTFALEPKFTIPGVGAVGVENTFLVTAEGIERLTDMPNEIVILRG